MSQRIEIIVYGLPAPQGSKSFKGIHGGRAVLAESSKKVAPWRKRVELEAIAAKGAMPTIAGPLRVWMVFTLPKPKSAPKRRVTHPDKKPDLSKLIRSTEDALTSAKVWEDDARVIEIMACKAYPGERGNALNAPGCRIVVESIQ